MEIIIFEGVLTKLNFSMKFPHLSKFINLMKDLKYEHQSISLVGEGQNLILETGSENQIFFLRTPATVNFFTKLLKNDTSVQRRKIITHPDGFL